MEPTPQSQHRVAKWHLRRFTDQEHQYKLAHADRKEGGTWRLVAASRLDVEENRYDLVETPGLGARFLEEQFGKAESKASQAAERVLDSTDWLSVEDGAALGDYAALAALRAPRTQRDVHRAAREQLVKVVATARAASDTELRQALLGSGVTPTPEDLEAIRKQFREGKSDFTPDSLTLLPFSVAGDHLKDFLSRCQYAVLRMPPDVFLPISDQPLSYHLDPVSAEPIEALLALSSHRLLVASCKADPALQPGSTLTQACAKSIRDNLLLNADRWVAIHPTAGDELAHDLARLAPDRDGRSPDYGTAW